MYIDQKKYKQALEMVSEDISSPYIPSEYLEHFETLYSSLYQKVSIENIQNKYNKMSKMELLTNAYDGRNLNVNVLSFFLAKFGEQLEKVHFFIIEEIFMNPNISNDVKIFLLSQLKVAKIDYDFSFFNNLTNVKSIVNTMSNFEFEENPKYKKILNKLEDNFLKTPSLYPLAKHIIQMCYEYYFGSEINYSEKELIDKTTNYINCFFEDKEQPDKQFVEWVNNLLTFKKLKN